MGSRRVFISCPRAVALAAVLTCVAVLPPAAAIAGDQAPVRTATAPGFFESIGRWFDQQANRVKSTFGGARSTVEQFGHEAGVAASTTVDTATDAAKDAADAVTRLRAARVVSGHEKCRVAPNGAPDCGEAAAVMCRTKGFKSGSSVDMTTAEVCPPKVWMAGRMSGPGCHTETFVSSALCQ
jgi:hypothetical protein